MDGNKIREVLLKVIKEYEKKGPGHFQQRPILIESAKRLGIKGDLDLEQALLTVWHDLFRTGHLSWGHNLDNPGPPFCHLTTKGREELK